MGFSKENKLRFFVHKYGRLYGGGRSASLAQKCYDLAKNNFPNISPGELNAFMYKNRIDFDTLYFFLSMIVQVGGEVPTYFELQRIFDNVNKGLIEVSKQTGLSADQLKEVSDELSKAFNPPD